MRTPGPSRARRAIRPRGSSGVARHPRRPRSHRRGGVTAVGPLAAIDGLAIAAGRAPRAGEHTRELLVELGLDEGAIAAVLQARAATEAER